MKKRLILSFVILFLISFASVDALYYYERTYSTTSNGNTFEKEIEFRGSVGPAYHDDYDRYYDGCSRRDASRTYYNRYAGRGYSVRCLGSRYYRPARTSDYTSSRDSYTTPRYTNTYSYDYNGRTVTRTSRY
ncbi:MAG: hypothetical protein Q8R00_03615 [Candidatus Nanoarchaeia archaeon]|nr:hypothetical protein [Candidatus Nanoarchaeia archaeon]